MNGFFIRNIPDRETLGEMAQRHPEMDPAIAEVYLHLIRFSAQLGDRISQYLGRFGLSTGRMSVLMMLHSCPEGLASKTPSELAERCGVTAATISRMVEGLIREGLVQRVPDPENRRISPVQLTSKGEQLLQEILPDYFREISAVFSPMGEEDRGSFLQHLNTLQTQLDCKEIKR